ncbi:MAG: 30S ribosomal protein S20 [Chloroflexota bacterium]
MANTKSAQKQMRVNKRRAAVNRGVRSHARTAVTKAEGLIFAGEMKTAKTAVDAALSTLDKTAAKGVIHPRNAARRKSRLMRKLNQANKPAGEAK